MAISEMSARKCLGKRRSVFSKSNSGEYLIFEGTGLISNVYVGMLVLDRDGSTRLSIPLQKIYGVSAPVRMENG